MKELSIEKPVLLFDSTSRHRQVKLDQPILGQIFEQVSSALSMRFSKREALLAHSILLTIADYRSVFFRDVA